MNDILGETPPVSRMAVAILALLGLFVSSYLTLYKLRYLGFIQCTTGGCEAVQASPQAIFLGVPVAMWGMGAYLALLALALVGLQPRWARERSVAVAIFAVATIGVVFTAYLTYQEAFVIHHWCQWCLVSAALITLIFLSSIPGLRSAR